MINDPLGPSQKSLGCHHSLSVVARLTTRNHISKHIRPSWVNAIETVCDVVSVIPRNVQWSRIFTAVCAWLRSQFFELVNCQSETNASILGISSVTSQVKIKRSLAYRKCTTLPSLAAVCQHRLLPQAPATSNQSSGKLVRVSNNLSLSAITETPQSPTRQRTRTKVFPPNDCQASNFHSSRIFGLDSGGILLGQSVPKSLCS